MTRPIPEYVTGPIRDIVLARWPEAQLKGLAEHAGLEYTTMLCTFKRASNRSLFKFHKLCVALEIKIDKAAKVLEMEDDLRRSYLLRRIQAKYGSVQELHRATGITDTYVENLFRGDTGERILSYYLPLGKALGLEPPLEGLTMALGHTQARQGYRKRSENA